MRFVINLVPLEKDTWIPYNYQYPLSAIIYQKLSLANDAYAGFLHDKGYSINDYSKHFKLFCYSDLQGKFVPDRNALKFEGGPLHFILACHMPEFAQNLVKGVFADQYICIGGPGAKATLQISQISVISNGIKEEAVHKVRFQVLSPMVVGEKNERGNYNYLPPEDKKFTDLLKLNLKEKLIAVYGREVADSLDDQPFNIQVLAGRGRVKSRLVTIKANSVQETKIKGFLGFELEMVASGKFINMALDAGMGMLNGMGFGCVNILSQVLF